MALLLDVGDGRIRKDIRFLSDGLNQALHGGKVFVRAQVLDLGLTHMQVILEALALELVVRLEPLGRSAEPHEELVRPLNQGNDLLGTQDIGQPAAVFGADDVLSVGKRPCARHAGHDGARLAVDALLGLFLYDRALARLDRVSALKESDPHAAFSQSIRGHQAADTAADDGYVIMLIHSGLSFACSGQDKGAPGSGCAFPAGAYRRDQPFMMGWLAM